MVTTRLERADRDLGGRLAAATAGQQRAAVAAVAVHAVEVTRLAGEVVEAAMAALRDRRVDAELSNALARVSRDLDERSLALREQADSRAEEDPALELAYAKAFAHARAAAAASWALSEDPAHAALEGVYEAYAAIGNIAELRRLVERTLGSS